MHSFVRHYIDFADPASPDPVIGETQTHCYDLPTVSAHASASNFCRHASPTFTY